MWCDRPLDKKIIRRRVGQAHRRLEKCRPIWDGSFMAERKFAPAGNSMTWRPDLTDSHFICKCINETAEGLRDGLSHYSGESRVAVIYMIRSSDPPFIFDPQHLLRGHEPKLKELYLDHPESLMKDAVSEYLIGFGHAHPEKNLELAGLVSYGSRSRHVFYQMWFTEHHPDICSIGPTECWLEHAAWRFSHDIANDADLYTGISGSFLREYAAHAVRDYIVDRMNYYLGWDTPLRIFPILDAILGISKTREEHAWPRGRLVFVERGSIEALDYVIRFPDREQPTLSDFKHVCKLLQAVAGSSRVLVSEGQYIVGIAEGEMPSFFLSSDFYGQYGYVSINDEPVCSFSDGSYNSTTRRAKLVELEEALLESELDPETGGHLYRIATQLVHHAQTNRFGCTLVLDLNWTPVRISGHTLEAFVDLTLVRSVELAQSLCKVDGALHICRDLKLHGFACLLDGLRIENEDRSRGARFNSALRFSKAHANLIVVVVSVDHPVSVIQEGIESRAQCGWRPISASIIEPQLLGDWIEAAEHQNGTE
jgi:hypothetical protein